MQLEYVPSQAKGKDAVFKGSVLILAPTFDEKYQYIEECGFAIDGEGNVKADMTNLGPIRRMVSLSKKHYKKVSLKHLKDEIEYSSFDDMVADPVCDPVLLEVAGLIMKGFRPSKELKPS